MPSVPLPPMSRSVHAAKGLPCFENGRPPAVWVVRRPSWSAGVVSNAAAPFGGVKQSGLGREGGLEGIVEYVYTQYIGIADPHAS